MAKKNDGYLEVASFIKVVAYSRELYPKGIKYFDVKGDVPEAEKVDKVESPTPPPQEETAPTTSDETGE